MSSEVAAGSAGGTDWASEVEAKARRRNRRSWKEGNSLGGRIAATNNAMHGFDQPVQALW